jgi:hypothetical protein
MREGFALYFMIMSSIGAIASMLLSWRYADEAIRNRKPGVPYHLSGMESPNNILFKPHLLTDQGLVARKNCFRCLSVWLGLSVLFMIFGMLAK